MYIEDLIKDIAYRTMFGWNNPSLTNFSRTKDYEILSSMSDQLDIGNALTEKQSVLALRVLNQCKHLFFSEIPDIEKNISNPKWKFPFRTLGTAKRVSIKEQDNPVANRGIYIEFPYENSLVDTLRRRNSSVHDLHRGSWSNEKKCWIFNLTEKNVLYLGDLLTPLNFDFDDEFTQLYNDINDVRVTIEDRIPILKFDKNKFVIDNCHPSVEQPDTNDIIEALYHARHSGVTAWDDAIDEALNHLPNVVNQAVLKKSRKERIWIDSEQTDISEFTDLINYGGKILIIIPGGSEYRLVKKWVEFAKSLGISSSNMSVMFRLPNDKSEFNVYVKEEGLNTPVTNDTKIVFVSTKITKPLVKSGIKFTTAINLGYYNYMHFSMNVIVDNVCNLVYYSMKAPIENKKWLPQEL